MGFEDNLRKIAPYIPGEQPKDVSKVIKLNTNENPYPAAPGAEEIACNLRDDKMRLYPPTDAGKLSRAIAKYYGVPEKNTFVGVGSDDVLATAFIACFNSDKPILFPDVTYSFYDVWAELYKIPYKTVPLDDNFKIIKEDYLQENGGIVIANPNAPTSINLPLADVEFIIKNNPDSVVIVDEAYVDFGGESAVPLLKKYENLMVVQTFSKSRSMAGMRIGYAFASDKIIQAMNDVKFSINSYTMNYPAVEMGVAAIDDEEYYKATIAKIVKTREKAVKELTKRDFTVLDSRTNFLFISHKRVKAERLFADLKNRGIFVRHWDKPRIGNYLRVTVGTDAQMKKLYEALDEILAE
ncbi:MAG: histidinol-phosphate transaminase [Lachnospiraceae bacterium]|nr:histidinol-phosphate transaminase [Lachnospiraceae bacterium]